jgi:hypothetical protein
MLWLLCCAYSPFPDTPRCMRGCAKWAWQSCRKKLSIVELRRRLSAWIWTRAKVFSTWRITSFPKRTYWPGLLSTGMKLQL